MIYCWHRSSMPTPKQNDGRLGGDRIKLIICFFAKVIQSKINNSLYKGHCQNLETRMKQHNAGLTKSTKGGISYSLVYYETFDNLKDAIKKEKYFKNSCGKTLLK